MASVKPDTLTNSMLWAGNSFLLDSLFELSPLGLCVVDERFRFIKVSKYMAMQINGLSVEEHLGKTVSQVIGKDLWNELKPLYQRALKGEYIHDFHITGKLQAKPKEERHFLLTLYPLPEIQEGKLIGVLVQEVTKQYEAEEELLTYQNRLEIAQAAGGVGVFEWDFESNEVWSSHEEIELFELNVSDQQGKLEHWLNRIHPDDKNRITSLIETSSEEHRDFDTEFRVLMPDDRVKWIRGKGKFSYNEKGEAIRLLGVNYDVTQRRKQEEFLRFKAEVSRLLMATLDADKAFNQICSLAVKYVADWCSVDMLEGNDFKLVAVAHKDPKKIEFAKKLRKKFPSTLETNKGLAQVIKTKQPLFVPKVTYEMTHREDMTDEKRKIVDELQLSSAIIVPLIVQGKAIGAISFILAESKESYSDYDLEITQQLAMRTSLYLENIQLYDQIRTERRRLVKLFENVPSVVFENRTLDGGKSFQTTFINAYAQDLMGYPINNWLTIPKFTLDITHPEDRPRLEAEIRRVLDEGAQGLVRFRWKRKDGTYIWVESRFTSVTDKHNRPIGMRGVAIDISERMRLEQRKDEFIATASHELKTPLTSLKVFTEVLKTSKEIQASPKYSKYLKRMESEVDRLTELVFDLLDLSKIQRGQLSLTITDVSLKEAIEDLIESIQPAIDQKIMFEASKEVYVCADKHRLIQVLSNLIGNAEKYSPDAKKIVVKLVQKDDKAIISVQDFGIGIAKEHLGNIFQRFYRVFDEQDKTFPGLGMGLFISKTIIERHGGELRVESTPGKGSTFYVSLPIDDTKEQHA